MLDLQGSWNLARDLFKILPSIWCELLVISLLLALIIEFLSIGISVLIPLIAAPLIFLYYIVTSKIKRAAMKFQKLLIVGFPILSTFIPYLMYESVIADKVLKLAITYLGMWLAYVILIAVCFLINSLTPLFLIIYRDLKRRIFRTRNSQ
ncbi:MAG: hypothetical protein DRO15_04015 [Thermoprotei archaeon]|nr:MAG: hypothetical protein DRO15_04015 [Thermoprotei archaeon]